jgi:hypothetical protein
LPVVKAQSQLMPAFKMLAKSMSILDIQKVELVGWMLAMNKGLALLTVLILNRVETYGVGQIVASQVRVHQVVAFHRCKRDDDDTQ